MINNINYFKFITDIEPMKRVSQVATTLSTKLVEKVHLAAIIIIQRIGLDGIELIGKICRYRITSFIAAGLLGITFYSNLSIYTFLKGTSAVPAIQVAKTIAEGKTLTEAIKDVAQRRSTHILAGAYAVAIGSQVGVDPRVSFTAGAAAIPTVIALNKAQDIKEISFEKINYGTQKIKDVFARIYQFLIDQLTKIKKAIQRTFSKDPKINTTVQQTLLKNDEPISSRKSA